MDMQPLRDVVGPLTFTVVDVGARPIGGQHETYMQLLRDFPGSRVVAFEFDPAECEQFNAQSPPEVRFYPYALGSDNETRPLYITKAPMCCSLYKPNHDVLQRFQAMDVAQLQRTTEIQTVTLDHVARVEQIGRVDLIKIDIQGAELDVFRGGTGTLTGVSGIVTEVEFVELYENQPLFGDVSAYLAQQGLQFHRFIGVAGRAYKPFVPPAGPFAAMNHLWADAAFYRMSEELDSESLLRRAVVAWVGGSQDLTAASLMEHDHRFGTNLMARLTSNLQDLAAAGA